MSGGSREPESPTDQQCTNCGRYYSAKGIENHEKSCSHPEWAEPLVPLDEGSDTPESVGGDTSEGAPTTQASPDPEVSDTPAETDGGLGLAGPPETSEEVEDEQSPGATVVEEEPEEEPETENCPGCGHDLDATEEELRERFGSDPFACGDCGKRLQVGT